MRAPDASVLLLSTMLLLPYGPVAGLAVAGDLATRSSFLLYRSVNHGVSWKAVGEGLPRDRRINALAVAAKATLAGTDGGIFISDDSGVTWSAVGGTPAGRVQCFAVDGRRVHAGTAGGGVWLSEDGGRSWRGVSGGLAEGNVRSLTTHGGAIYAGTDGRGVFVRRGGEGAWGPFGEGLPDHSQVFDLAAKGGRVYAALYSRGLYRVGAAGGRWERVGEVEPLEFLVRGDSLVAGLNPGGILHSADEGKTWTPAGGLPGGPPTWVLGEAGPNLLAGTSPGALALSGDEGRTWKVGVAGLPPGAAVVAIGDGPGSTLAAVHVPGAPKE